MDCREDDKTAAGGKESTAVCNPALLLLSSLLREPPDEERVNAMGCVFSGDEEDEFFRLLRIPADSFVPPFLAAHQEEMPPQRFVLELLSLYRKAGFAFDKSSGERPDHIAVILEFMALLEPKDKGPIEDLRPLAAAPIERFAEAMSKAATHPLYKKTAEVLSSTVQALWKAIE